MTYGSADSVHGDGSLTTGRGHGKKKLSKSQGPDLLKTRRSQLDRILDPKSDVTLSSLQRAAVLLGRVMIELV
jgi:hypothetical protein